MPATLTCSADNPNPNPNFWKFERPETMTLHKSSHRSRHEVLDVL